MAYIDADTINIVKKKVSIQDYMKRIAVPELGGYYSQYAGDFTYRDVAQCPVHQEDTPSFRWFPETNSCYCYACKFGGDVIALHRKFMEVNKNTVVNFNEAVEFLKTTFIDNKDYEVPVVKRDSRLSAGAAKKNKPTKLEIESESVDISRYNMMLRRADDKVIKSLRISEDMKIELYMYIELVDTLLAHKKIGAVVARQKLIDKLKLVGIEL